MESSACVFCDIIRRNVDSYVVYEDDRFIAFLDRYPVSLGHTLVSPKKHYERIDELSREDFCVLFSLVHSLNRLITSRLNASASHISINDGSAANQLIPHVHVHIIPRNEDDSVRFSVRKYPSREEMDSIRRKLEVKDLNFTS